MTTTTTDDIHRRFYPMKCFTPISMVSKVFALFDRRVSFGWFSLRLRTVHIWEGDSIFFY